LLDPRVIVKKLAPYTELVSRRGALGRFGATATLLGCSGGSGSSNTTVATSSRGATGSSVSCVLTPEETAGPYPLFNDIAIASTYMREDITEGGTGVPLQLLLTFVNVNDSCAPITDARIYTWHCDKDCIYSGYSQPGGNTVGETFCRGVRMTDSSALVRFTTIYPGWYSGRITHVHFRAYLGTSLQATDAELTVGIAL
jgi:Protocatechuate 3,4-dioxygenase beta subunit